jgi:tRNA(Ile)-lysidine synthase
MIHWTPLHDRLHVTLRQRHLLPKAESVLIAVSGGQDSLCLARLLLDLQPKWGWQLAIAHCNHRWRDDADANAEHVAQLAAGWGLPYYSAIASSPPPSEASAREWRYQELAAIAQQQYRIVVTGHTESDRAETLLYNLIRGSGADGLQALTWKRGLVDDIQLVRPLLEINRRQTAQFCRDTNLPVWQDSTNQDWRYTRNRLRAHLLPVLAEFNPQVEHALAQTAELLRAEIECLEDLIDAPYQQAVDGWNEEQSYWQRIDRSPLQSLPLALQRRVMRRFLHQFLQTAPNFDHVEKITGLIAAPNRSQTDPFGGGAIARVEGRWIVLQVIDNQ